MSYEVPVAQSPWSSVFMSQGDPHSQDIPPDSQPPHMDVVPAHFESSLLLTVLMWLLLYILSYRTFAQLAFRQFSLVVVLYVSCSFDVVVRGGQQYLPTPLS